MNTEPHPPEHRDAGAVDLTRPRTVNEIIEAAVTCYRVYPLLFATLALVVIAPYGVIVRIAAGSSLLGTQHGSAATQLTLNLIGALLVGPLISALHIHAVALIGQGQRPMLQSVMWRGLLVIPVVAAAEIVAGLGIALGLVLLIVPGVILALRWAVVAQVAALERVSWLDALRRSRRLTAGNYRHVFGLIAIVTLFGLVLTVTIAAAVGRGAGPVEVVVGIVVETFTRSLTALTTAVLYFDLVARHSASGSVVAGASGSVA